MPSNLEDPNVKSPKNLFYCNNCRNHTNHLLLAKHSRDYDDEETGWWEWAQFNLWVCAGCDNATLAVSYEDVSMYGYPETQLYPKRQYNEIKYKPFIKLPKELRRIYKEIVQSYNNELNLLCAVGIRALIEGICDNKGIKGKTLEAKINNLNSILPNNIVENIHSFRFMGNTAVHDLTPPTEGSLRLAIEIIEDLLNFLYELDYKARRLTLASQSQDDSDKEKTLPPPPPNFDEE